MCKTVTEKCRLRLRLQHKALLNKVEIKVLKQKREDNRCDMFGNRSKAAARGTEISIYLQTLL